MPMFNLEGDHTMLAGPKARRAAALALIAAGCVHTTPTPAVIAQMNRTPNGATTFRGCTVSLAWTLEDLLDNCGPPDLGYLPWENRPGSQCALYSTAARSFAAGMGADAVAVCLTRQTKPGVSAEARVWEVFGLESSAVPPKSPK